MTEIFQGISVITNKYRKFNSIGTLNSDLISLIVKKNLNNFGSLYKGCNSKLTVFCSHFVSLKGKEPDIPESHHLGMAAGSTLSLMELPCPTLCLYPSSISLVQGCPSSSSEARCGPWQAPSIGPSSKPCNSPLYSPNIQRVFLGLGRLHTPPLSVNQSTYDLV